MGLLKHVVLPLYALLNLAVVFGSLVAEDLLDTDRVERKTLTKRLLLPSERPPNTYHHVPNTYNPHPR